MAAPQAACRTLCPGDEDALEKFLVRHADSSMFLRSNLRSAGLVDRGQPFEGTYVAGIDERGNVSDVVCRCWNGTVLFQAPRDPEGVARAAARQFADPISGLLGPWEQTAAVRRGLGLADAAARLERRETLYSLDLATLAMPLLLARGEVECRHSRSRDLEKLIEWRLEYHVEALQRPADDESREESRREILRWHDRQALWVLEAGNCPVAMTAMNATLRDCVQVGGVWTPPELRCRGYARAAVAGSLLDARAEGVSRAILFADNPYAQRAYAALGFRRVGEYAVVLGFKPCGAS